jgi:L-glutamine:2-deoxy-scyllo-inosose/3-amino-2,3-dideoxy-scyllo-inosose aminotransferase
MNQEKVLTCGEGGAVITNDQYVYDRLFRSKTDGCAFDNNRKDKDEDQLIYENVTMGGNYCMSEFQAAILISQLEKFDTLNSIRRENAGYLDEELSKIEGIMPIRQYEESTKRTVYEYGVRVDNRYFANKDIDIICRALSAELGFRLEKTDIPVYRNKLFDPSTKNRYKFYLEDKRFSQLIPENYPKSELLYNSLIVFHHSVLLAERKDMNLIIGAFRKVRDLATTM